jgi:superfamily I DNA/RNA helicase
LFKALFISLVVPGEFTEALKTLNKVGPKSAERIYQALATWKSIYQATNADNGEDCEDEDDIILKKLYQTQKTSFARVFVTFNADTLAGDIKTCSQGVIANVKALQYVYAKCLEIIQKPDYVFAEHAAECAKLLLQHLYDYSPMFLTISKCDPDVTRSYLRAIIENIKRNDSFEKYISNLSLEEADLDMDPDMDPETDAPSKSDETLVEVGTIHQAKGMEFPAVIVWQGGASYYRADCTLQDYCNGGEDSRLFYVACSRAQNSLTLFYSSCQFEKSSGGYTMLQKLHAVVEVCTASAAKCLQRSTFFLTNS